MSGIGRIGSTRSPAAKKRAVQAIDDAVNRAIASPMPLRDALDVAEEARGNLDAVIAGLRDDLKRQEKA